MKVPPHPEAALVGDDGAVTEPWPNLLERGAILASPSPNLPSPRGISALELSELVAPQTAAEKHARQSPVASAQSWGHVGSGEDGPPLTACVEELFGVVRERLGFRYPFLIF